MTAVPHISVMLEEVLTALAPKAGEVYVDGTFGAGGYTRGILASAHCRVVAVDRDPGAKIFAEHLEAEFPDRFAFVVGNFADMCELLAARGVEKVDGVVLDLGVSSMQIDEAERGFSFRHDGPLDMRMAREGLSAADVVNTADEAELADILYHFGEEKASRRIARAIVAARAEKRITRTGELAEIVRGVMPYAGDKHPATRTFQALRIHVNDELGAVERGLAAAARLLAPGGRLVVVTFHSLEDRLVKRYLRAHSGRMNAYSRHVPEQAANAPLFTLARPEKRIVSAREAQENPRARSATLRAAIRTEVAL